MAERDRQRTREVGVDIDVPDGALDEPSESDRDGGERDRSQLRRRAERVLSPRALLVALVVAVGSVLLLGGLVPFGTPIGIFAAAFLYGAATDGRRYAELGLAGGAVGGISAVLGNLTLTLLGPGVPIALVGAAGGLLAGVLGHYFGRDLRDGLTREL